MRPWQVWWMDMGVPIGHEQGGVRPVVVVGSDFHCRLPIGVVLIASMTTRNRGLPHHVPVFSPDSGLRQTSYVLTEQVEAMSVERFTESQPIGELVESERSAVRFWLKKMVAA
ncbi:MAG TPA: type II toxin-antitoxin system PemK/MazF family toxin [Phytomonospora sp.]